MNLASDPTIQRKITRMAERVRWKQPALTSRGIDQTRLVLEPDGDQPGQEDPFHFLVLGDSGTGRHRFHSPPRRIAERLLPHKPDAAFLLHTGDVVYLVGAADQYRDNFLRPYREWLQDGEQWSSLSHEGMVFNQPFLPVPGNHDYYDLSFPVALVAGLTLPLRRHLQWFHDVDAGWRGSGQGEVYAQAFMDVLHQLPPSRLEQHLETHYDAVWDGHRCLHYRPGRLTRLPNRYYRFRHAGVDVFAIDSNTLISPVAPSKDRRSLQQELQACEHQQNHVYQSLASGGVDEESRDALLDELETLQESILDLRRRIGQGATVDEAQLKWLMDGLIASHRDPTVRGRILTMHHPPYVTEATKWTQADTMAIRLRLRQVLDGVAASLGNTMAAAAPVDLVLSGHAHCLEVLRTHDTGHADSGIHWVICGGSGYGLRSQRREGARLMEMNDDGSEKHVASSDLYIGKDWPPAEGRHAYSGLRVDIAAGRPLTIRLTPLVSCRADRGWSDQDLETITLSGPSHRRQ